MSSSLRVVAISVGFAIVATLAVAALILAANRPAVLATATTSSSTVESGILTSGDATVSRKPDLAMVNAGIQSQQSSAAAAQADLAAKAGKLISRVKSLGVPDGDLSTSGYWVGPIYGPNDTVTSYRASEQLQFKWHTVDNVGKALDAIVQEGGATNETVSFGLNDPKSVEAEARSLAIADARSRANAMATAAGVRLGQVVRVSDLSTVSRPPVSLGYGAALVPAPTQVPVGQMDVQVTVEVDFAIG